MNMTQSVSTFVLTQFFFLVYVNKKENRVIIKMDVKIVPELKGSLRLFTKNTSR